MAKSLDISPTLSLPLDYVTQRGALLAVSGAGKSNAARSMAEEFFARGLPFVAIDPKGDWWGLRAGKDGRAKGGLGVVIFGGKRGDVPLERGGGTLVADAIVDQRLSCVVDLSRFESEADKKAFLLDFAKRLYFRNEDPLHLFLEEADDYIPQQPMPDERKLLRAFENIVRRGRSKGLGITLITQRSASVNKNVLTQVETLFALRTTSPQDIKAIEAWMQYHGADRAMLSSLAGLGNGEAWVWSPHYLKRMEKIRFRLSRTFDSGATPKNHGSGSRRAAATLKDVDLEALGKAMAETIERVAADDPKELRRRVAELEKRLREQKPVTKTERVEVPVLGAKEVKTLERLEESTGKLARAVETLVRQVKAKAYDRPLAEATARPVVVPGVELDGMSGEERDRAMAKWLFTKEPKSARIMQNGHSAGPAKRTANGQAELGRGKLGKCARALLGALIQHGAMSLGQAALIAGYSGSAPIVIKSAGELRAAGLVAGGNGQLVVTEAGRARPEVAMVEPMPTGPELARFWLGELGKCESLLLGRVLDRHPKPISLEEATAGSEYEAGAPIVIKSAGRLRTLMLVSGTNAAMTANERLV